MDKREQELLTTSDLFVQQYKETIAEQTGTKWLRVAFGMI